MLKVLIRFQQSLNEILAGRRTIARPLVDQTQDPAVPFTKVLDRGERGARGAAKAMRRRRAGPTSSAAAQRFLLGIPWQR